MKLRTLNRYVLRSLALASVLSSSALPAKAAATAVTNDFPVWIELDKPQLVTVAIEDAAGYRVRNLVAEMQLPAGKNRLSWDGYDDGKVNADGDLIRQRVQPGSYTARGLTHDGLTLTYEFAVYSGGNPPWPTKERTGGWLADHSCPLGAVFLPARSGSPYGDGAPQVLLTSLVAEAGAPLVWVGLDGQTFQRRQVWGWDGAIAAARDAGKKALPDIYAYLVMAWEKDIVIRGLKADGSGTEVVKFTPDKPGPREPRHEGHSLTVQDGLLVFNAVTDDALVFVDVASRKILGKLPVPSPRALLFDARGRLLVISEGKVLRHCVQLPGTGPDGKPIPLALLDRMVVVGTGLENPRTLAFDPAGKELYVADWGKSHQVKVFTPEGKLLRTIGKANNGTQLGLYDESKMQAPLGLAIDDRNQLWVVEATHLPKRISLWNATSGAFLRANYGPPHYGGGGTIDPTDKTRLFYREFGGLMEFALDWKSGTAKPKAICVNSFANGTTIVDKYGIEYGHDKDGGPSRWGFVSETPTVINGRTYFIGSWTPGLRGNEADTIWLLGDDHIARPVARIGGSGFSWPPQLNQSYWNLDTSKNRNRGQELVAWSDRNGNQKVDADEYSIRAMPATYTGPDGKPAQLFGIVQESVFPDLSMTANWGVHIGPPTFDAKGVPSWDLSKAELLLPPDDRFYYDEQFRWGQTVWPLADGWTVVGAFSGFRDRKQVWSYPVNGNAPPMRGGEVVQPTRVLGVPVKAATGEAGYWYAMNGEKGNMFLMTSDGLFLQTLGGDMRTAPLIRLPKAERSTVIDRPAAHVSFEDEHFCPTITQTAQGEIYLVAGKEHSSIFRVDGFASVKRRDFGATALHAATLAKLPAQSVIRARRQDRQRLAVEVGGSDPVVNGKLTEYNAWATLGAGSGSVGRQAAVRIGATRLYAAFRTGDPASLANGGGDINFLFKRGGCVDLMIATKLGVVRDSGAPVAGDLRLLVTTVKGVVKAVLYRAVVPGTAAKDRVLFESPIGSVWFDSVTDVSAEVKLAQNGGDIEFSVPLKTLGLDVAVGAEVFADLGLLRGDGSQTIQRLYWNNLDTLLVSDIPSEARLQPGNWGVWKFIAAVPPMARPAVVVKDAKPGLRFTHHLGRVDKVPDDLASRTPANVGVVPEIRLDTPPIVGLGLGHNYLLEFTGYIRVPSEGVWTFSTTSDDGSRLWIGDSLVVDNDGGHAMKEARGMIRLAAGLHPFRLGYFQGGAEAGLKVAWSGPAVEEQPIPAAALLHAP